MTIIQKAIDYNIPYELMHRLNYSDLLYMVVNYDILKLQEYFREKARAENNGNDFEVIDATPEMASSFFKR